MTTFRRLVAWLCVLALVCTQPAVRAGPAHDEGIAAGATANAASRSTVNEPSATGVVPGYTRTPGQRGLYGQPTLSGQAQVTLQRCLQTPNESGCQAILGALRSANNPREVIGPYDGAVSAAHETARNPGSVVDLSAYYTGCQTTQATGVSEQVERICQRDIGDISGGELTCRRDLSVQVKREPNCEAGSWFAQGEADNGLEHLRVQAQCRPSPDGTQRLRFHATGNQGACREAQVVDVSSQPSEAPFPVAALAPRAGGACRTPYPVVAMPGSGCTAGQCDYSFQFGAPTYACPAGSTSGANLLGVWNETSIDVAGPADRCYANLTPTTTGSGDNASLVCPAGSTPLMRAVGGIAACISLVGSGTLSGASGGTVRLAYEQPTIEHTEVDTWLDHCPSLDGGARCSFTSAETCVEGSATRSVDGQAITRGCWSWQRTLTCAGRNANSNACAPLAAAGCTLSGSACAMTDASGRCTRYQDTYRCPQAAQTATTVSNCPANVFCVGDSCFNTASASDADFARSMAFLEAGREAGVYLDPDKLEVFRGESSRCADRLLKNCCMSDAAGSGMTNQRVFGTGSKLVYDVLMNSGNRDFVYHGLQAMVTSAGFGSGSFTSYGITFAVNGTAVPAGSTVLYASSAEAGSGFVVAFDPWSLVIAVVIYVVMSMLECNAQEGRLAMKEGAGLCHLVGSHCASSFLGSCLTTSYTKCCFNSVLSRIINEQGRAQVGRDWGSSKDPDCSGFTVAQLQSLDFSRMDLSEFYASLVPSEPDNQAIVARIGTRVPTNVHGATPDTGVTQPHAPRDPDPPEPPPPPPPPPTPPDPPPPQPPGQPPTDPPPGGRTQMFALPQPNLGEIEAGQDVLLRVRLNAVPGQFRDPSKVYAHLRLPGSTSVAANLMTHWLWVPTERSEFAGHREYGYWFNIPRGTTGSSKTTFVVWAGMHQGIAPYRPQMPDIDCVGVARYGSGECAVGTITVTPQIREASPAFTSNDPALGSRFQALFPAGPPGTGMFYAIGSGW